MRVVVEAIFRVEDMGGEALPPDSLEAILDRIMEALLEQGQGDSSVGGTLSSAQLHASVILDAASLDQAYREGVSAIRLAIHTAGGATPGWEDRALANGAEWAVEVERLGLELQTA